MTSSISSFAIDKLDEKHQDSFYLWSFSREVEAKLPKFKEQSCIYPDEPLPETFQLIDDPICEQELEPIGSSKSNIINEKTLT